MRITNLVMETVKSVGTKSRRVLFTTATKEVAIGTVSVFLTQQVETGAESISAVNLVSLDIGSDGGAIKVEAIASGEKEVGHLNEADLTVNALLIGESS